MNYRIKELNNELKPRERLKKYGVKSLSDGELLAIILRCGTKNMNVLELSNKILTDCNGITNLSNISLNTLSKIKGIGEAKAISILASLELGKRSLKINEDKNIINNSKVIYDLFKYDYINVYQEHFTVLFLDVKKNLITKELLYVGTISTAIVHPREVFKSAIKHSASCIILLHNHPSGDSTPSNADIDLTKKIKEAGDIIGIPLIDHIIIGHNNYYSFYNKERIDKNE